MALLKLKQASIILLEDDYNKNLLPIIKELVDDDNITFLNYEYPASLWLNVFKNKNITFCEDAILLTSSNNKRDKRTMIIDSVNQMAITLGWDKCLENLKKLVSQPSVSKLLIILHKDCILPGWKIQMHLIHIANAIVSYDAIDPYKIKVQIKIGGKLLKTDELLSYDYNTSVLTSKPIKFDVKEDIEEEVSPINMSTFKIEVDQINQLAKHQLKLPYMSKINEGQGKVYYEPDAVDDWDDEDPDDDLDI